MPIPDLGQNILAGGSVTGVFTLISGQRILADARQSYINSHVNNDLPGHNWSGPNESGDNTNYPGIVPMNNGWLAMQQWLHSEPDTHWSSPSVFTWKITFIGPNGDPVWEKTASMADLNVPWNIEPGTSPINVYGYPRDVEMIAGNDNSRILYRIPNAETDTGVVYDRYYWLDFDADGDFVRTFAFRRAITSPPTELWSESFIAQKQKRMGSGYIAWSNVNLSQYFSGTPLRKVYTLDANLNLVGSGLSIPAQSGAGPWQTTATFVTKWNGEEGLWFVAQAGGSAPNDWRAAKVNFDGVNPATFGSVITGSAPSDIWNSYVPIGNDVFLPVTNWDEGTSAKSDEFWVPRSGAQFLAPNPNDMEWVYSEDYGIAHYNDHTMVVSVVTNWFNAVTNGGPYDGDDVWGYLPPPLRLNVANVANSTGSFIDIDVKYPVAPSYVQPWGNGYGDSDMDDAGYTYENEDTGRVLILIYHYWAILSRYSAPGYDHGQNRMSAYWVGEFATSTPPPTTTMPSWWNAFGSSGSSGGGVAPGAEGDCARLGQGENVAYLFDRGGTRMIARLPSADMGLIRWNRKRDDISNCTMALVSPGSDCCQIVREMQAGRHEIVVFRNGDRVWEGPITRISYKAETVEVEAHDVMHYASRTIMRSAYDNRYRKKNSRVGPVTKRAQVILQNELIRKERLGYNILKFLDVRTHPKTTRTSRYTPAYYSTVWEEMEYLGAKLSLDYTVLGRRIIVNDVHDVLGRVEMLTDKDFTDELIVTSYGMELRTRSAVTDGEGRWAAVGGVDPYYGEVEFVDTMYGEQAKPATTVKPTKEELAAMVKEMTSQAQRNLTGRYPIPTLVRIPDNTQLSPEAPVTVNELIPGIRVPIRATLACLELEQEQKLDFMQVEQQRGSDESVTITLSPAPGSTPWDDSSETSANDEEED